MKENGNKKRRCFSRLALGLRFVMGLMGATFLATQAVAEPRPRVGAIRWDAWHGELSDVGKAVERTLSPPQYHFRLPWFAQVNPDGTASIRGDAPGVFEQEIAYARQADLDYWAFVLYPETDPLSLPLLRFLELEASARQGLKFCAIVEWARFGGPQGFRPWVKRLVGYFRHPAHLRVMGGRPLLYLLAHEEEHFLRQWSSVGAFSEVVRSLRQEGKQAGVGNPYIVVMHFSPQRAAEIRSSLGADAISAYAFPGGSAKGAPFAEALETMRRKWGEMARLAPTVPLVSWGWDPRPRIDNPVPWHHRPALLYYETFTPEECAQALKEALDFVSAHPEACPANAVIAYAWNEFDEGGWLCPTRSAEGQPDTRRVEAVGQLLRSYQPPGGQ